MNDLEVQRKDEIIEVQTPIIEPIKTKNISLIIFFLY